MKRVVLLAIAAAAMFGPAASAQSSKADQLAFEAVQRHVDAYRSGSLSRFVATFTDDAFVSVGEMEANGRDEIRQFYASNFSSGLPHTVRIVDSSMQEGWVMVTVAYTFADGQERCCTYSQYLVRNGKIAQLLVSF